MKCSFMSRTFPSEWKKAETNSEPWLEVMCMGMPCLEKTWRTNNLANIGDVMVLMVGIKIDCLGQVVNDDQYHVRAPIYVLGLARKLAVFGACETI